MKLLGALLLAASSLYAYISRSRADKAELDNLNMLIYSLSFMRAELSERLTPVPELMDMLRSRTSGQVNTFFTAVAEGLSEDRPIELNCAWESALISLDMRDATTLEQMRTLGARLGKYSLPEQLISIDMTLSALRELYDKERRRWTENRKLYLALYFMPTALIFIILI